MSNIRGLKTDPEAFEPIASGAQPFHGLYVQPGSYTVGDTLHLREFAQGVGYTGREVLRRVTCVVADPKRAGGSGLVILGLANAPRPELADPDYVSRRVTSLLATMEGPAFKDQWKQTLYAWVLRVRSPKEAVSMNSIVALLGAARWRKAEVEGLPTDVWAVQTSDLQATPRVVRLDHLHPDEPLQLRPAGAPWRYELVTDHTRGLTPARALVPLTMIVGPARKGEAIYDFAAGPLRPDSISIADREGLLLAGAEGYLYPRHCLAYGLTSALITP